ncbi:unnamed protein product, partial [Mesorhabditis spiculigera]
MRLKHLFVIVTTLAIVECGAIWDSVDRVWKTTGATRGLPTTPGNCIPKQPTTYPPASITFERQYQLRQGPGTLMTTFTTMMDCFNACYSNSNCTTMWFAGYNRSCTHYPYTMKWYNYNQTVKNAEYVYTKRYGALVNDPRQYTIVNPLITIRQKFVGTAMTIKFNSSLNADGPVSLCVAWRPAMKCKLQAYMLVLGTLQPHANKNPAFFLSTEKTSECGSFKEIYEKNAGNGLYQYSNDNSTTGWAKLDGIFSWDVSLC